MFAAPVELASHWLRFRSAHRGCSPEPFVGDGPDMGGRLVLLSERVND